MKKRIASLLTFAMLFTVACDAKSKETSASDISSDMSSESSADHIEVPLPRHTYPPILRKPGSPRRTA